MNDLTIDLTQLLPPETLKRLQAESSQQHVSLSQLVRDAIEVYLDEPLEDTPDEKIIADFKEAWHQAMTGQVYPIDDLLSRLREEDEANGDQS
ncbi:MAG: hypothetical protein K8L91_33490 [Anaerolineae bacterium]|nr:hypothetical protein [Anaerolineae bacterium]